MSWLLMLTGLAIAVIGSAGAVALVTTARAALAEAIARRLRGGDESLAWLANTENLVVAATAGTSLGVTMVGVAIPAILGRVTLPTFAVLAILVVVPTTLFGGYLIPRWLTVPRAGRVVEALAPVLSVWRAMLVLVLPAGRHAATEDVRHLAREGTANGLDEGGELVMVGGVMTFAESGYTRLPVYRDTLDEIIGMVHAFDVFKLRRDERFPIRPVSHAPEQRMAGDLLLDMQRERRHLAVVVDEFGGTAGIVTLEDLLEALVGEIADEDDDAADAPDQSLSPDLFEADGTTTVREIEEHFEVILPEGEAASLAGRLMELSGRIPQAGERFVVGGLEVDILGGTAVRLERLLVRRPAGPPQELGGGR